MVRLLCPSTEKKDKILSAHNQIDAGNLLSNVNVSWKKTSKKIKWTKKVDLQTAIATIITNPNETRKNLKREKYMVLKSYFQNNY